MNLHRVGEKADWADVPHEKRTFLQKVAALTRGAVTPGNVVSLVGLGLVASGLRDVAKGDTLKGTIKMGIGRLCDNVDGAVAHATHTKSAVGEALDVAIDKVVIAAAVPVLMRRNILPDMATTYLIAQNVDNTLATAVAKYRGAEIHSSEAGKSNIFGQSGLIGMALFAAAARENNAPKTAHVFEVAGAVSLAATALYGVNALGGYIRDAAAPLPETAQVDATVMEMPSGIEYETA